MDEEWKEKSKSSKVIQRDLEDQIEEEYKAQGKTYQKTETKHMEIRTKEVAELLQKGYTRYAKDDKGFGSIQEKYGLKGTEVVELFSRSSLKHRKTILPKSRLQIVDDLTSGEPESDSRSLPATDIASGENPNTTSAAPRAASAVESLSDSELFS